MTSKNLTILKDYRDNVMARVDMDVVIGGHAKIVKPASGHSGKGSALCPFHADSNPSLAYESGRKVFKCFGCGVKGTAIDFVMLSEKLNFTEALDALGSLFGVERPSLAEESTEESKNRASVYKTLARLAEDFHEALAESEEAREYLWRRMVGVKATSKLYMGYTRQAPPTSSASRPQLEALGMVKGDYYSWGHAISFPFIKHRKCVYMTSRKVGDCSRPHRHVDSKYVPRQYLYNEGALALGEGLVIVESPMCAASIIEATSLNPVATLGTNGLTPYDVLKIGFPPWTRPITLCYDCHEKNRAGENATYSVGKMLMLNGHRVSVMELPEGIKDPNAFFMGGGTGGEFEALHAEATDFVDWIISHRIFPEVDATRPFKKAEFIYKSEVALSCLTGLDPAMRDAYVEHVADSLGLSKSALKDKLNLDILKGAD